MSQDQTQEISHEIKEQLRIIESGDASITPLTGLIEKLKQDRPLRIKLGVDPTAPDLHIGHAVPLRKLRQFQDLGHKVILIIGDFTAQIGDPSGRDSTRPPLSKEEVLENAQTYIDQAWRILLPEQTEIRYNSEWLGKLNFSDILQIASRFTVARILERDDFSKRYNEQQPISLHEFLYPLAQSYDSVAIKADLELGGTDQLFNLLAGRELMEKYDMEPQVTLTMPLLEGTDGVLKMSKSYGNYIGLTDTPEEMFGKVMSIPDTLIYKYYLLATMLPFNEIEEIGKSLEDGTGHPNKLKRRLAREIISLYHSAEAAVEAEEAFNRVFRDHQMPEEIDEVEVELEGSVFLPALLSSIGFSSSNGEARRFIDGGGVRVDGEALAPKTYELPAEKLSGSVIQVGRRKFARLIAK